MKLLTKNQLFKSTAFTIIAFSFATSLAFANPQKGKDRPIGPPPEAIEACVDLAQGDAVSFENKRVDTVTGTCQLIDEQYVALSQQTMAIDGKSYPLKLGMRFEADIIVETQTLLEWLLSPFQNLGKT